MHLSMFVEGPFLLGVLMLNVQDGFLSLLSQELFPRCMQFESLLFLEHLALPARGVGFKTIQ